MEKATIYDYARLCASFEKCNQCVLHKFCADQRNIFSNDIDKANEIIINWCEEHPIKTRQSEFLKLCPNAPKDENGIIAIPSCNVEEGYAIDNCSKKSCTQCRKEYWLAEVDENE